MAQLKVCSSCSEKAVATQREQQKSKGLSNYKVKCSAACGNQSIWYDSAVEAEEAWNATN